QLLKDGFVVNTILKEADLFCPNSVRINFTIYQRSKFIRLGIVPTKKVINYSMIKKTPLAY
ncbi:hypothetical protein EFR28_06235, partial [Latilactobacillus curvatus]|uniref:hypothetical protein n=1 Tax=Latilactobacillus curvatus TaxID=28038 RepID=UPI0021A88C33